jgi:hypothetical protein
MTHTISQSLDKKKRCQVWGCLGVWQKFFVVVNLRASSKSLLYSLVTAQRNVDAASENAPASLRRRRKYILRIVTTARQRMHNDTSGENLYTGYCGWISGAVHGTGQNPRISAEPSGIFRPSQWGQSVSTKRCDC